MTWQAYASTRPRFLWMAALLDHWPLGLRLTGDDWPG